MLENPRSPRVRAVAKLAKQGSARRERDCSCSRARRPSPRRSRFRPELVVELFATPTALERHPDDRARPRATPDVDVEFVTEEVLDAMADTVTPQGFVAVVPAVPDRGEGRVRREAASSSRSSKRCATPATPARSSARRMPRAPTPSIFTGRTVDLYNPKVVRSSTGSLFHLPVAVGAELADVRRAGARRRPARCVAADVKGEDLLDARGDGCSPSRRRGCSATRRAGSTDEQLALADRVVTVPIYGHAESMNLATAASVCLYESAFAQRSADGVTRLQ